MSKYAQVCNMFVRVILIATVLSFVYMRSTESREVLLPSTFDKQRTTGIDVDTESTKIVTILLAVLRVISGEEATALVSYIVV